MMKVLIIAPSWVGDAVMSHSLCQLLLQQHANIQIDVLALPWCKSIYQQMPEISNIIDMPFSHGTLAIKQRYKFAKQLVLAKYQQAIILPFSLKSALIPYFANIPLRTGWRGEMRYLLLNDVRVLDPVKVPMMVQRYALLGFPKSTELSQINIPLPKLTLSTEQLTVTQHKFSLERYHKIIVLCPGAEYGPAKCWPHYHFAKLASLLINTGYSVCLLGSPKDKDSCNLIYNILSTQQQQACLNLAGKTNLVEAMGVLASSLAVVSNDSGLMHVAAALNKPVVALYGPTTPEFAPPLTEQKKIIRLINDKFMKIRRGDQEFGYHKSMVDITPELVQTNLYALLNN